MTVDGVSLTVSALAAGPLRGGAHPPHAGGHHPVAARCRATGSTWRWTCSAKYVHRILAARGLGGAFVSDAGSRAEISDAGPRPSSPSRDGSGSATCRAPGRRRSAVGEPRGRRPGRLEPGRQGAIPAELAALEDVPLDDVLYLPPVPARRAAARDELARARLVGGTPVLIQLFPGEETDGAAGLRRRPSSSTSSRRCWSGTWERLRQLPSGATAVWPLLPGLTDDPALWELGCRDLAAAGVRCVQALTPALTPADRRKLAERWGEEERRGVRRPVPPPAALRAGLRPDGPPPRPGAVPAPSAAAPAGLRRRQPLDRRRAGSHRRGLAAARPLRGAGAGLLPRRPLGRPLAVRSGGPGPGGEPGRAAARHGEPRRGGRRRGSPTGGLLRRVVAP